MQPSTPISSWPRHRADWVAWAGRAAALLIVAWSPFSGGPRVPSLALALLGLWALARGGARALDDTTARRWLILFALLWVPALLSLPGSVHAESTLKVVAVVAVFGLTGLGLLRVLDDAATRAWLQRWLAVVLLVWVADSYLQFAVGRDLLGVPMSDDGRVVGMFDGNLRQALILAALSPVVLWWLAARRMLLAALGYAALLGVVVLSGARLAWFIALMAGGAFLWLERRRVRWPVLVAGLVVAALVAAQSPLVRLKLEQTASLAQVDFAELDRVLGYRLSIWDTALAMVEDRPLLGVGAGAFDEAYGAYSRRPGDPFGPGGESHAGAAYHAHQMYVSVAAERGLVGLAALLALAGLCIRWYLGATPAQRAGARPYGVSLAVVAFPVNSQPILFTAWWLPVLILTLCLFLAHLGEETPASP